MLMNEEIQRINLDDYIQIGEGSTALTYTHRMAFRWLSFIILDSKPTEPKPSFLPPAPCLS